MKVCNGLHYYNLTDMARAIGLSIPGTYHRIYVQHAMSAPSVMIGRRNYWPEGQFARLVVEQRVVSHEEPKQ